MTISPATPPNPPGSGRRSRRLAGLALLLALGTQPGCGREFYREWANQDVTEAVFEKSRDPRWRMDLFSVEPPALSRFVDPYDPDRPPAPPDDFATQSLSPAPQWPDHRLMIPTEGAGYIKFLDQGPRYEPPAPKPKRAVPIVVPRPPAGATPAPPPTPDPSPFAPGVPATLPGPGASLPNSGPNRVALSPIPVSSDDGVRRAAMQDPTPTVPPQQDPMRTIPPRSTTNSPTPIPPPTTVTSPDPLKTPQLPNDPSPVDDNLSRPNRGRVLPQGATPEDEEIASNLARMFVPEDVPFDETIAAGLPRGSRPYVLSMEKAYQLALINSRVYQTQLENVYLAALPVTLQRFSFQPQAIAGLSPATGIAGAGGLGGIGPAVSPVNSFLYSTRATGAQTSALNYGTVAGVGKLFDNGTRVLASFANQVVFNFVGKTPAQPTVRSFLPIQAVVPFLRGGGRAVTLEALTQAERNLVYSIRLFAKFRQEFAVTTLVGGQIQNFGSAVPSLGFTVGGNTDPTTGYLNVVEDVQLLENTVKNLAVFERFAEVYKELINGESSGLSQLQLDQIRQQVQGARSQMLSTQNTYRADLDNFKLQLGMPPDVPIVIDRARTRSFQKVFEAIDQWSLTPRRELRQLSLIIASLPDLEDLVLDGRSTQAIFSDANDQNLEGLLLIAERVALENRLDLMNNRAALYDAWRQIRVTANALKGILNVAVTNQFVTPPTTNNPFGFVDQAKSFSLVLNAELPLVRVAERNNFRNAIINYERQRRALMNAEDAIKLNLRSEIRGLGLTYRQYKLAERNLEYAVTLKDQAFEQIVAPPQPNAGGSQAPLQTTNLISFQSSVLNNENNLVTGWYNYQSARLQIYRDLGILPYDEWEAFDEIFPPDQSGAGLTAAVDRDGRPAVARAGSPAAGPASSPAAGRR